MVTGAAGFIGGRLAERLIRNQIEVRGVDSLRSGDWSRFAGNGFRLTADLRTMTANELDELCLGAKVLFHIAAEKHNSAKEDPQQIIDVNISATRRLFDAAARVGVRKVVFTSSLYVYGSRGPEPMSEEQIPTPNTMYGLSKLAGEHLLRIASGDSGLGFSIARLFFIYGPRQYAKGGYKSVIVSNFERIRRGEAPIIFGDGHQALDYTYVDDAVDALLLLASTEHDGSMVNIGSGQAVSVAELTERMLEVAGSTLSVRYVPADWTAGSRRVADCSRARSELGWEPQVPLRDGLTRIWNWMSREHG